MTEELPNNDDDNNVTDAERAAYFLLADRVAQFRYDVRVRSESVMGSLDSEQFDWGDLSDLYALQAEVNEIVAVAELLVEDAPAVEKPPAPDDLFSCESSDS